MKDLIVHITWYEKQMVGVLQARALIGSEWWDLPTAQRNGNIYEESKAATLEHVVADAAVTHQQLVHWISTLSDRELNEPGHFRAMPEDWVLGDVLAENTFEHYGDHAAAVARWLADHATRA